MKKQLLSSLCFLCITIGFAQEETTHSPHSLTSHGYLRTGFGRSLPSGEMVQFQLPETLVKSRFGNEANHYGELQFDYKYQEKNSPQSYEIVYMMSQYWAYKDKNLVSNFEPKTAQLYFKWNNIHNKTDIWVGRRYYQRLNIDILDYFWLNAAQNADVGVGVEQIDMGKDTELDLAIMRFTDKPEHYSVATSKEANLVEHFKLDARWKNITISEKTKLNALAQVGYRPEVENPDLKSLWGYTLGLWGEYQNNDFYNRTSLIFRKGINMVQNPYTGKTFLEFDANGVQKYNLSSAYDVQFTSDFRYDNQETFGILGAVTYHHKNYGIQTASYRGQMLKHLNFIARYSKYLSKHFRLTTDASYGYVDITDTAHGGLFKLTLSPELSWNKGMFSRPSLRPFITYARWSDALKGKVGVFNENNTFVNKNQGVTCGIQMEVWW